MILVDTCVWIVHFRKRPSRLTPLLDQGRVLAHPFIIGELACGPLRKRARILGDLRTLPSAALAAEDEVMRLIENRSLWGLGIGWIDAHLLASALISNCELWTLDAKLVRAASAAGVKRFPDATA